MKHKDKGIVEKYLVKIPLIYYTWFYFFGIMLIWIFSSFQLKDKILLTIFIGYTFFMTVCVIFNYQEKYLRVKVE